MPRDSHGRRRVEDDVLTGFERTGERKEEFRGFFTVMLAASLYTWDVMFDLGAYHTLFFYREDRYFIISVAVLVGVLVVRTEVRMRPWLVAAVAPPALLFLFRVATPVKHPDGVLGAVGFALTVANLVALPLTAWVVARLLAPEYFEVRERRHRITVVAVVTGVAVAGFLAGQFNHRYLTCEDFTVAGYDTPGNCHHDGRPD